MKRDLTSDDVEAAIWGGAILGGGGGGLIGPGLERARAALDGGKVRLWTVDEFDSDAITATVAIVGAPASAGPPVEHRHLTRSLDLLRGALPGGTVLAAINTNENGAETTANGWLQSLHADLPVLDFACNGRAHPTGLMGALGLHRLPDYRSIQAFSGGADDRSVEGAIAGRLERCSGLVVNSAVQAGGMIAVSRNPVSIAYARAQGAPGAISHAISIGTAFLSTGLAGVAKALRGRIVASGQVIDYRCKQRDGLDVGRVLLDDKHRTELRFVNEYMLVDQDGGRVIAFPNLIMTFAEDGQPLPSARVAKGMAIQVLIADAACMKLAATMAMPELYASIERLLRLEAGACQAR